MKTLGEWFEAYGASHRNQTNKAIHFICVPLITFSILGLLWAVTPWLALLLVVVALIFYFRLSTPLALAMLLQTAIMLGVITLLPYLWQISLGIFVIAWIFQFIGHKVEGKKPSFFQDIQFLLIGPIWIMGFLFRKFALSY